METEEDHAMCKPRGEASGETRPANKWASQGPALEKINVLHLVHGDLLWQPSQTGNCTMERVLTMNLECVFNHEKA
jgi:hypothetical protein